MGIVVVGSVAYDSVETPFGSKERVLGGSATYFSTAASFFTDVALVAVVGDDFAQSDLDFLAARNIDLNGLSRSSGKTFHWKGRYGYDLNEAQTLETHLNVFETFRPTVPEAFRNPEFLFLANIDPLLQMDVLQQVTRPRIVACDTMNFWIDSKPGPLKEIIGKADILVINEGEARQLSGEANLVRAAKKILAMGVPTLIVKRGEYGVVMFNGSSIFSVPAFPLEDVFDPTGAGDTFAGGFMGCLANTRDTTEDGIRQAIIFGSVMASFNVEDFSLNRLKSLTYPDIEKRYRAFRSLTSFLPLPGEL